MLGDNFYLLYVLAAGTVLQDHSQAGSRRRAICSLWQIVLVNWRTGKGKTMRGLPDFHKTESKL